VKHLTTEKQHEYDLMLEEYKTKSMEDEHKIRTLMIEKSRLQDELKIYKYYEQENKDLHDTVRNLTEQISRIKDINLMESEQSIIEMEKWKKELEMVICKM